MTELGLRFLLFLVALVLSLISIVLEPRGDGGYPRMESPKVEVVFPGRERIFEISRSIERAKAIFDILNCCKGKFDSKGFIAAGDFERAVLEAKRLGEIEVYRVSGKGVLILRDFGIVVVER